MAVAGTPDGHCRTCDRCGVRGALSEARHCAGRGLASVRISTDKAIDGWIRQKRPTRMSTHAAMTLNAKDTSKKPMTRSLRGVALWVPAAIGMRVPAPQAAASSVAIQLANAAYTMSQKVTTNHGGDNPSRGQSNPRITKNIHS